MAGNTFEPVSLVDSTFRLRWELTREEFDNCQFPESIRSIHIGNEESEWIIAMHPKGRVEDENMIMIYLERDSENKPKKIRFNFGIETPTGFWPTDFVKDVYSRGSYRETSNDKYETDDGEAWCMYELCKIGEFAEHFVENKITVVASLVIYKEGVSYQTHTEIADKFVVDMRFMSSLDNLSDVTLICDNKRYPCHRVLLAARSEYFEALFRNEPNNREVKMEESLELVEAMLDFMFKGRIPSDIDTIGLDLILMADMYRLELLTVACATSMVNNLSPDNAIETLITVDKLKHVSDSEHRRKILAYITKEASQIVKTGHWEKLIKNYPGLVTEIVLELSSRNCKCET